MRRALAFLAALAWALLLPAKERLELRGDHLLYSYDYNYIYGQGAIQLKCRLWTIHAEAVEIDVANRAAYASRGCRVEAGKETYTADALDIDLESLDLRLTTFADSIRSWTLPGEPRKKADAAAPAKAARGLVARDVETLRRSLVYFLNQRIVITPSYRVYGFRTTVFLEGVQSLGFKKLKLDQGAGEAEVQGVGIDKIWYYPSQGAVVNAHVTYEKKVKAGTARTGNVLNLSYDVFNNTGNAQRGRIAFTSASALDLGRRSSLGLDVNAVSGNMFNVRLALRRKWAASWSSDFATEYSRTAAGHEELWLRLGSSLQQKWLGALVLDLGYEKEDQFRGAVSWRNQALKHFSLSLQHSVARLLQGDGLYNRQDNSLFSLAYTHRLFQMTADYSFHRDLLLDQSQGTPRFVLSATPFRLYHGLLRLNLASSVQVNQLNLGGRRSDQARGNLALSLQSEAIRLGGGPALSFSLAAEQLLDRERLNRFTSLGCVIKCSQPIAGVADLDFLYNYNTRRQSESWLIQGTTSQDWSAVLRLKDRGQRLKGWVSLSYDTKTGRFTSSYLDAAVSLFKNWQVQTQMNYDFLFRNFNYDLYLVRFAGRIMLRASYRSLSKRVLLEILPR